MTIKHVAIIHNGIPYYRAVLFNELSKTYEIDVLVTEKGRVHECQSGYRVLNLRDNCGGGLRTLLGLAQTTSRSNYDSVIIGSWDNLFEITQNLMVLLLSRLNSFSVILWTGSWNWRRELISVGRLIASPVISFMTRISDACIVYGTKSKELLRHLGVKNERIFVAYNYSRMSAEANSDNLNPATLACIRRLNEEDSSCRFIVLYLSRIVAYKGLDVLLKAFSLIENSRSDVTLVIAGTGPELQRMRNVAKEIGLGSIHFVPIEIEENDKHALMKMCDVFVLPSRFHGGTCESWGLVLNEAMSLGKPVIATDAVGASYDLVRNGENGYVAIESNPESLADCINKILCSKANASKMGERAKEIILQYFPIERTIEAFDSAIKFAEENKLRR